MRIKQELLNFLHEGLIEAGCDEAGRGPLAGPVFAAAVILPKDFHHPLLNDSKKMSEKARETLRPIIEKEAIAWAVDQYSQCFNKRHAARCPQTERKTGLPSYRR